MKKFTENLAQSEFVNHKLSPGFNPNMKVEFHVPNFIIEICREYGIPDEQIPSAFHSYVEGAMDEYVQSGQDCPIVKIAKRDFRKWCQDNTTSQNTDLQE